MIVCSAQKQLSCSVPANGNANYDDASYTKTGYTWIGVSIHSFEDTLISVTAGYAGASIGIRFKLHCFSSVAQNFTLKYRHLYIKS